MCQPVSKGGKRCLAHQAGTTATTRYVSSKLKVAEPVVRESIKELNKEGRNLPTPSQEEVKGFIALEEFKTKLDPELSEHDKKIILKNYDKARTQAETQGVTGGAFHAWKNAFARVYGKIRRSLAVAGATGLVVSVAACGGLQASPTPSGSDSEPANPGTPTTSQPAEPGTLSDLYPDDASIPAGEVTDEYGTYVHVTVDPNGTFAQYDPSIVQGDLAAQGFSEEQAREAHDLAARFFVEQTIDSPAYDNSNVTAEQWYEANNGVTISSQWYPAEAFQGDDFSQLVINQGAPNPTEGRTGGQRSHVSGQVQSILPIEASDGTPVLMVSVAGVARTPLSDTKIQEWITSTGGNPETFRAEMPELFDGNDSGGLSHSVTVTYTFSAEDISTGVISGHNTERETSPYIQ